MKTATFLAAGIAGLSLLVFLPLVAEELWELDEAESFVCSPENPTGRRGGGNAKVNAKDRPKVNIKPGETAVLVDLEGPGRIEQMWVGGAIDRGLVLRMYWDGETTPAVEAPLPFFFGGLHFNHQDHSALRTTEGNYPWFSSAMIMVSPALGCNSYFRMPFRKHAKITLENVSTNQTFGSFYAISGSLGPQSPKAGYFHARFHEAHPVRRGENYTALDLKGGKGRYVGMTFVVQVNNPSRNYQCWCEGEPRIYLDGEATPSLLYTGLEDYFCGSYNFGRDNYLQRYQPYQGLYTGMYATFGTATPRCSTSIASMSPIRSVSARASALRWTTCTTNAGRSLRAQTTS